MISSKDSEQILEEYSVILKEAFDKKIDKLIPNSTGEHAYLGIKLLISGADPAKPIKILSNDFYEKFWTRLKEDLLNYISKKGCIKVLLLRDYRNDLVKDLMKKYKDNFVVQHMGDLDKEKIKKIPHFIVAESGYRLELSDQERENNMVEGVINFGDQAVSDKLGNLFDIFFNKSSSSFSN